MKRWQHCARVAADQQCAQDCRLSRIFNALEYTVQFDEDVRMGRGRERFQFRKLSRYGFVYAFCSRAEPVTLRSSTFIPNASGVLSRHHYYRFSRVKCTSSAGWRRKKDLSVNVSLSISPKQAGTILFVQRSVDNPGTPIFQTRLDTSCDICRTLNLPCGLSRTFWYFTAPTQVERLEYLRRKPRPPSLDQLQIIQRQ